MSHLSPKIINNYCTLLFLIIIFPPSQSRLNLNGYLFLFDFKLSLKMINVASYFLTIKEKTLRSNNKILGTLYGQAIGDAMGMPTELWTQQQIKTTFPTGISDFVAGPPNNDIAKYFQRGQYTDDTNQALVILESLIQTHWQPETDNLVQHLLAWAKDVDAWKNNILGPSSKAALTLALHHQSTASVTATALTNGAAMRIAPIGTLFTPDQQSALVQMVVQITQITHSSDVAYSGACLIAGAVSAAMVYTDWEQIVNFALQTSTLGFQYGAPTWAANINRRVKLALHLAQEFRQQPRQFRQAIYEVVGTGTMLSESVPAAFAIAYYWRDVQKCALFCANLGGDTDTIGAMATAICGAYQGSNQIPANWMQLIDQQNSQHDLHHIAQQIMQFNHKE